MSEAALDALQRMALKHNLKLRAYNVEDAPLLTLTKPRNAIERLGRRRVAGTILATFELPARRVEAEAIRRDVEQALGSREVRSSFNHFGVKFNPKVVFSPVKIRGEKRSSLVFGIDIHGFPATFPHSALKILELRTRVKQLEVLRN